MEKLKFVEKDCFEQLFEMGGGYVLNFSNRTFQEFVYDVINIDIYLKYPNTSKGRILKSIMQEYDNIIVGKLLLELMRYMQTKNMVNEKNCEVFKQCAAIGNRLIGRTTSSSLSNTTAPDVPKPITSLVDYEKYSNELLNLSKCEDSPQSRGFAFEKYLKDFFNVNQLQARGSFKIVGEQIDGSFILHNEVYLLEAKWTNKPISLKRKRGP